MCPLNSSRAIYPRIITSKEVGKLIIDSENEPGDLQHLFKKDVDGEVFIDLTIINDLSNQPFHVERALMKIISSIPDNELTESILQKYEWLKSVYRLNKKST